MYLSLNMLHMLANKYQKCILKIRFLVQYLLSEIDGIFGPKK